MIFEIDNNNKTFIVDFKHNIEDRITTGILYLYDKKTKEKEELLRNIALCNEKDQYNKSQGRKVVLRRLLHNLRADRCFKTQIWKQYFIQTNKIYCTNKKFNLYT